MKKERKREREREREKREGLGIPRRDVSAENQVTQRIRAKGGNP